jgi:hypothetical protein
MERRDCIDYLAKMIMVLYIQNPNDFSNIGMQNPPADEKLEGGGEVFVVM